MNPEEANAVLAYCVGADSRLGSSDAEQATTRAQVWADLLAVVDAQFALDHVRRFYVHHHDWPITPGAIRDAWMNHQRVEAAKTRHAALLATEQKGPDAAAVAARERAKAALRESLAAHPTGPQMRPATIPHPVPDHIFSPAADDE